MLQICHLCFSFATKDAFDIADRDVCQISPSRQEQICGSVVEHSMGNRKVGGWNPHRELRMFIFVQR